MKTLYTNQGSFFGYIESDYLFTYEGTCAGKVVDNNIYRQNGNYLGEISTLGYLVTDPHKKQMKIDTWDHPNGDAIKMQAFQFGRIGVGSFKYVDFPEVETF